MAFSKFGRQTQVLYKTVDFTEIEETFFQNYKMENYLKMAFHQPIHFLADFNKKASLSI
jgi:hypothetical protein